MHRPLHELSDVQRFVIAELGDHPKDIARVVASRFAITRQAANRQIRRLVDDGLLIARGETRSRHYEFAVLGETDVRLPNNADLQEDLVWRDHVAPLLAAVPDNVRAVCQHGLTEMVNNAKDHSESPVVGVTGRVTAVTITIHVWDAGVGIFRKIKEACELDDERHAIFELVKGKLTTDPARHTGEGIFFTSRMFDRFGILSGRLYLAHSREGLDWLLEDADPVPGTSVKMEISSLSTHTTKEVFERYATDQDDYAFSRTHVGVALAKSATENLISRSQAKRVVARLDRFKEIVLDFHGVDTIGPAFADEIFRVFTSQHPEIRFTCVRMSEEVQRMVRRAQAAAKAPVEGSL